METFLRKDCKTKGKGPPDMMSALEGGGGDGIPDVVREVACLIQYNSIPNADKGEGGQKIQN